ncbi:MAG TPA: thiol peroxidase [Candidatus Binatia bacterium]|jgi:thiol peroxidase|nr:thiol peroxidase [Candidatus Binatia bacterium]
MGHLIRITMVTLLLATAASAAQDAVERTDLVTKGGKPVTLVGRQPAVGDPAPTFTAVANDMSTFTFDPTSGKVWIISVVPSVDTPVCSLQTNHFNDTAGALGGDVAILTVSMDLPFAQKRWCGAEGVKNLQTVSDYRDRSFADAYGLRIKESGLLARSVFVVGRDGKITYVQLVPELTQEPQYEPVLAAARTAAGAK